VSAPPPAAAEPIGKAEFAACMAALGPFEKRPELAVAVSGGADSMALLLLAARWARLQGGRVVGMHVDHGLRPESGSEAATVAAWLAARRIPCLLLPWAGPKPASRLQEEARRARYRLLARACREGCLLHLLIAHQYEDQAETVAMRAARGDAGSGQTGMSAVRELNGLRLLRPLLPFPRARLEATLRAVGQPWLEDPSNRALMFERARLRADPQFDPPAWWAAGFEAGARRRELELRLAAVLARTARLHPLGYMTLEAEGLSALPGELAAITLARCLTTIGGREHPPARPAVARLLASLLVSGSQDRRQRHTLGGCLVERRGRELLLCREPGRIRARLAAGTPANSPWDGRFIVATHRLSAGQEVAALGRAGRLALPPPLRERHRAAGIPDPALESLPAVWSGGRLVACPLLEPPHHPGQSSDPGMRFRPYIPLAAGPFALPIVV
jgi:tRNA(Ile)-lysidine synthase